MTLEATSYRYEIMGSRDGIACQAKIEKTKIAKENVFVDRQSDLRIQNKIEFRHAWLSKQAQDEGNRILANDMKAIGQEVNSSNKASVLVSDTIYTSVRRAALQDLLSKDREKFVCELNKQNKSFFSTRI